jgi:asparagine synthase (glutamine-hydrolysing)
MCGIAGFTNLARIPLTGVSAIIRELQRHRGPDDFGCLTLKGDRISAGANLPESLEGEAVFLHWRLSILDLTKAGWQPMSSRDGRYHLIFNGEIYNYVELRRELESAGLSFHSHSDTEVLLQALVMWGTDCLTRLIGMFAFALLDSKERTILLARDYFGIKPLFYTAWEHGLVFASEIKALLEFPGVSRNANADRIHQYLQSGGADQGADTMFESIRQLPPAHWLRISVSDTVWPEPTRYWAPKNNAETDISYDEAVRRVRELILKNVTMHMRSDVPVGAALSGGIDSSIIVSCMRHLLGAKAEIHTFTYVEPNSEIDEEKWADLVNKDSTATSHKIHLDPDRLRFDFDAFMSLHDQPVGGTSIYAQYAVFRAAREAGIKVMLDGQGADEIFGGYNQYLGARLASLFRGGHWIQAARFSRNLFQIPGLSRSFVFQATGAYVLPEAFHSFARKISGRSPEPKSLNTAWFRERNVVSNGSLLPRTGSKRVLSEALKYELTTTSLPSLLRYEDQNSMAHSIESRVPFLTPALVDFAYSLPEDFIISEDGRRKRILRDALKGIVPPGVLTRKDKIGFATAEYKWIKGLKPWISSVLGSETARSLPMLYPELMLKEFEDVCEGRKRFNSRVWRWVNFIEWTRRKGVTFS